MKKGIIIPLLLLIFTSSFSQELNYEVRGKSRLIKKEVLVKAKSMSEIIPYYPSSWIKSYVSVEVSGTVDNKLMTATSLNDTMSLEQLNILNAVDFGTDIVINIKYKAENNINNSTYFESMHYSTTVVPEIEAEYPGGNQQMTNYLKENAINKISEAILKKEITVRFTVKEGGEIINAQITKSSGDFKADQLLLDSINQMAKWRPAENSKGIKVKQEFEFSVGGNQGC